MGVGELALGGIRAGELTLPPDDGGIECPTQSSAGDHTLVVWIR